MGVLRLALVLALIAPAAAAASDRALLDARDRYLPAAQRGYAGTPDGAQARYDAGRDLVEAVQAAGAVSAKLRPLRTRLLRQGRAQVARAEALDRPAGSSGSGRYVPLPAARLGTAPRRPDATLDRRLTAAAARFDGWAGIWVHELRTGRFAGVNEDLRFPAASTVKLGALVTALRTSRVPNRGALWYDARQIGAWSSNLAANRITSRVGFGAVADGLRRLGMTASTYPTAYRATTAVGAPPPGYHTRVTTARDLGRALWRLHAAARGDRRVQRLVRLTAPQARAALRILLSAQRATQNLGLLRPWLPRTTPVAEKNGWISDTFLTAAIVHGRRGPVIVVVEAYRGGGADVFAARRLGRDVLDLLRLR